jgi:hypothetical protein
MTQFTAFSQIFTKRKRKLKRRGGWEVEGEVKGQRWERKGVHKIP